MAQAEADLFGIDQGDLEPREQKRDGDTSPHGTGADNADRLDLGGRGRGAGDPKGRALGEEEVPSSTRLLRLDQLLLLWRAGFFGFGGGWGERGGKGKVSEAHPRQWLEHAETVCVQRVVSDRLQDV